MNGDAGIHVGSSRKEVEAVLPAHLVKVLTDVPLKKILQ